MPGRAVTVALRTVPEVRGVIPPRLHHEGEKPALSWRLKVRPSTVRVFVPAPLKNASEAGSYATVPLGRTSKEWGCHPHA